MRNDDGCEVIFVEDFEVLRPGAPRWHRLYRASWWLTAALPALWVILLWLGFPARAPGAARPQAIERLGVLRLRAVEADPAPVRILGIETERLDQPRLTHIEVVPVGQQEAALAIERRASVGVPREPLVEEHIEPRRVPERRPAQLPSMWSLPSRRDGVASSAALSAGQDRSRSLRRSPPARA